MDSSFCYRYQLCRQPLTFESQIDVLDEINNSELNDYDKTDLALCCVHTIRKSTLASGAHFLYGNVCFYKGKIGNYMPMPTKW